jgi:DNA-binding response OmpR family regulator
MRILVVEDQIKMANFIKRGLTEVGYSAAIAETGESAEAMFADNVFDLIIMDINLPGQSGLDTARHFRRDGFRGPILMLTALGTTRDKVHGLDAGADDYLTKPFEFEELLARIRALLRRHSGDVQTALKFDDLEMDLTTRKVKRGGHEISLTNREFSLLEYFLRNPEKPVTRTALSEHVWDVHFDTESNVIDVYVNLLRKKIDQPFEKKLIHTVVGVGYALKAN